jgi:murein DD-endopeptidase MepM/ murein hydrolase activator NlpD
LFFTNTFRFYGEGTRVKIFKLNAPGTLAALFIAVAITGCATDVTDITRADKSIARANGLNLCSDFGSRKSCTGKNYRLELPKETITKHKGIDFRAPAGTPVISSVYGKVTSINPTNWCKNNLVVVSTAFSVKSIVSRRNSTISVQFIHIVPDEGLKIGTIVSPGTLLGTVDPKKTACSSFPHIHLQIVDEYRWSETWSDTLNPNNYWFDGPGKVTCYREGVEYPRDKLKLVAPLLCNIKTAFN